MRRHTVFLKVHPRPVMQYGRWMFPDVQGRLPVCWCEGCGVEVFESDRQHCFRCARRMEDETDATIPLYQLPEGGAPSAV